MNPSFPAGILNYGLFDPLQVLKEHRYHYENAVSDLARQYALKQPDIVGESAVKQIHELYMRLALRDGKSKFPILLGYFQQYVPQLYKKLLPDAASASSERELQILGSLISKLLLTEFQAEVPKVNKLLLVPDALPEIRSDKGGMQEFIDSVRYSVATENWFGALFMALALPDICAAVEFYSINAHTVRRTKVGEEYKAWFNKYLKAKYDAANHYEWLQAVSPNSLDDFSADQIARMQQPDPRMAQWKFTAEDCYLFRCKALHQGLPQRGDDPSSKIHFSPPTGAKFHQTRVGQQWWLAIDLFSEDICQGVEQWLLDVQHNANIQTGLAGLMTI